MQNIKITISIFTAVCLILLLFYYIATNVNVGNVKSVTNEVNGYRSEKSNSSQQKGDGFIVPNYVHYIWYSNKRKELMFQEYLSVLSVHKFQKPEKIFFHTNFSPNGVYWEKLLKLEEFVVVTRDRPKKVFGVKMKKPVHVTDDSDIARVQILLEYGGIYLDTDIWLIRSFDPLRRYSCVLGAQSIKPFRLCGSMILANKTSPFLKLWMEHILVDYQVKRRGYNSGQVPTHLSQRYPDLVHIEMTKLQLPSWNELEYLYGNKTYPWRDHYSIHLWRRRQIADKINVTITPDSIQKMTSTFGQVAKYIYNSK